MHHHNDTHRPRIVLNECADEHDIVTREVVAPPAPARMVGAERGQFEDARRAFTVVPPRAWRVGKRAA